MAKYIGKDGVKKGKLGKELYYYAFQSNLVRELPRVTITATGNCRAVIFTFNTGIT